MAAALAAAARGARRPRRGAEPGRRVAAVVGARAADHARRRRRPARRDARRAAPTCSTACSAGRRRRRPGSCGCARWRPKDGSPCPVIAVNEAHTERAFNDRFGTGQSALDGILRTTNLLLAGRTVVVLGYGWTAAGSRSARTALGAQVIVCEVDPMRALEARMDGFEVMPALVAAERGDVFITVTGVARRARRRALRAHEGRRGAGQRRPLRRRDRRSATLRDAGRRSVREVRPLVEQYAFDGRRAEPAGRRPGGEPRRGRGPPGRGDGHLLRAAGAGRRGAGARRAGRRRAPGARRDRPRGRGAQAGLAGGGDRRRCAPSRSSTCVVGAEG